MKNWFETWFDSPYYPILYNKRSTEEAELFINKLLETLQLKDDARIFDVGCGRGRHSIYLAQKGYDISGIDLSPKSILQANISSNEKLEFFVHDMRRLFRTNYYDCAVNLFTSFGYFEKDSENLISVQNISKALKPKGLLVLDYLNVHKAIDQLKAEDEIMANGIRFSIKKYIKNNFIIKEINFYDKEADFHFFEKVGILDLEHFKRYFALSGLKLLNLYGNYQLESFDSAQSDRLIMIAAKI